MADLARTSVYIFQTCQHHSSHYSWMTFSLLCVFPYVFIIDLVSSQGVLSLLLIVFVNGPICRHNMTNRGPGRHGTKLIKRKSVTVSESSWINRQNECQWGDCSILW